MMFTTYSYALFLGGVFALHWLSPARARPWILIVASYVFYGTWRWPYVGLLIGITLFNWAYARRVLAEDRDGPVWPGVAANLLVLFVFKYLDFVVQNGLAALRWAGFACEAPPLDITLPLGISFFTFQGIAYLVEVAGGEPAIARLRDFMLYKAFWPQLIAGPIIRPGEIRAQIEQPRLLDYADVSEGARRILQGAFKKVVLADSIGQHVDLAFLGRGTPHATDTLAGVVGFGFQIYFDFSAYSDFAIGSARLFGFRFPENFDWPYLSRSPQEFWTRWHMSLSRWIRDYLFTPLSFASRRHPKLTPMWLILAMALCGLWHGAAWTFIAWGFWHGVFLALPLRRQNTQATASSAAMDVVSWLYTMCIVFVGWLLFRAPSMASVFVHLRAVATFHGGFRPALIRENGVLVIGLIALGTIIVTLLHGPLERWYARREGVRRYWPIMRPVVYAVVLAAVIALDQEAKAFVYFQF